MRAARIITVAVAASLAATVSPVASSLLPGLGVFASAQGLPSQIEVPAGQTVSVDAGVPVNVAYNSGGWSVSASGSVVSVTAPNQPGATASVTASAVGRSATVTLVAVGGDESVPEGEGAATGAAPEAGAGEGAGAAPEAGAGAGPGEGTGAGPGEGAKGDGGAGTNTGASAKGEGDSRTSGKGSASAVNAVHPPRNPAASVKTTGATVIDLKGEIRDNVLTVKVSLGQAADLMKYTGTDRAGAKLRYVDVNGQIIQGVKRDIDPVARELTLTYPEGETPDNPFILEVVRDDKETEFIAVITAANAPVERATDNTQPYARFGADEEGTADSDADAAQAENSDAAKGAPEENSEKSGTGVVTALAVGAVVGLILVGALVMFLRQRRSK